MNAAKMAKLEAAQDARLRRLVCEALDCVFWSAGPLEADAVLDALEDRGVRVSVPLFPDADDLRTETTP